MVNSMVDRATSSMLIGPDWAMNIEICDICNHDPVQAKEVVKGIKKRIRSKNPKVQLLALTLLETIVKNCGDIVHMHVAERDVLTEMVKIVKKKPDFHVKEKVLTLVDTWQEAFGGARARYPQYFAAYQELLRIGAVFPQRSDSTAPVFTPPQTNPLTSFPQNLRNAESGLNGAESSSAEAEFPTLSLTEIQNARGIMDVLAEMLNAIDPANKEELKQDVIVDLVEQCRNYKQRVVHLVNSTVDESLLEQGLTLNDELQRVLAKHEAIASGTSSSITESDSRALVPVDAPLIDTGDTKTLNQSPTVPSPVATNGPLMDFLSGDDFGTTTPASGENSLAIVPTTGGQSQPVPVSPVSSDQNALALVDMFSQHNPQQQQNVNVNVNVQSPQYQNGFEQSGNNAWNVQPLQQPASPAYGGESGGDTSLPPPPWEAQSTDEVVGPPTSPYAPQGSPHGGGGAGMGMYMQQPGMPMPGGYPQQMPGGYPQQMPGGMYQQPMQSPQMAAYMYQQQQQQQQAYNNQMAGGYGYGYGQAPHQQQNAQFLEQRMSGMSMRNDGGASGKSPSYVRPSKPEDKLFGDLVDMTKFKPK